MFKTVPIEAWPIRQRACCLPKFAIKLNCFLAWQFSENYLSVNDIFSCNSSCPEKLNILINICNQLFLVLGLLVYSHLNKLNCKDKLNTAFTNPTSDWFSFLCYVLDQLTFSSFIYLLAHLINHMCVES